MKKLKLFFACLLMAVLSIGQVWADVESGTTYTTDPKTPSVPANWTVNSYDNTATYTKLASNTNYIQTEEFCQNGFTSIKIKARKFGGPSAAQAVISVEWFENGGSSTVLATVSPTSTSLTDYTLSELESVTGNKSGYIKISCKAASGGKGCGVSQVTITYTAGTCGGGTPTCATPTFLPAAGSYEGTQNVTISSTADATIYYTTDGSTPSASSSVYSSPIAVSADMTIKAYAVKAGYDDSEVATAAYTITEGPDVTLNLIDGNWSFPTSGGTSLTEYTNSETGYKVSCYAANEYKVNGSNYFIIGKSGSYILLPEFANPIEKIVVVGNSAGSGSVIFNIFDGDDAASTAVTGCTTDKTFEITNPAANKQYSIKVTSGHNLQLKAIKIYYGAAPAVAKPTISGADNFLTSTEVSIACTTDGATVYYTTDGTDPKTSESKQTYSAAFTLTNTATVRAIATKDAAWSSEATSKTFTKITPINVAAALSATSGDAVYVQGTITSITEVSIQHKNATYVISDVTAGVPANEMIIYRGKYVDGADFDSEDQIHVGDVVVVSGTIGVYQEKNQMAQGNQIETISAPAVAAPVFEPNGGGFMGETDVTITCATGSSTIYYTLDGTSPTKLSTLYEGAIHLTATTTITAIAYVGEESSLVVAKEFTLTAPMTVAEAYDALTGDDINNAAVAGIVYQVDNISSGHATYWISDNGEAGEKVLEVYNGYGLNGASIAAGGIQVGDEVTVFGNLTIYVKNETSTKEFKAGSRLLAFNRPEVAVTGIDLTESTAEVEVGKTVTLHASVVPANATNKTIVWSVQSGSDYASVENGVVTGIAVGEAVIRAASDENASIYEECTVTVTEPAPLSPWASVYTSNVAMAHTGSGVDNGTITIGTDDPYLLVKAGASSSTGTIVVTVPKGTTDLHFHAFAWGGKTAKIELAGVENASVSEFDLAGEAGASGSGNDFTLQGDPVDQYFHVSFDAVAAETEITFSKATGSADNRFFFYGVNQEGGLVLESISVSGTATALEYNEGDHFSPAGLGVTGHYSDASTAPITEGIVWAFDPDPLTEGTESVSVTATAGGFTSAAFVVDGLTVAGAAPLSPWASVYTSNVEIASNTAAHVTINGEDYDAAKTSKGASATITLPQGVTAIHLHLVAWNGEAQTVSVTGDCFNEAKELSIEANAGVSGSGTTYDLGESGTDYYFSLTPDNEVAANTVITIAAASGKRFVLFGVNQEGGVLPVLESIEIKGDLTTKTGYKAGDALNLDGLTVEATYSIGGVAQTPVDITDKLGDGLTLTYDPLVENQTEVTITASYKGQTDDITITGLDPVASADPKIYVSTLNVNFASVEVGEAVPANKTITVTLTNVASVTATLGGTNPEAFSIDKTALVDGDVITISVIASTAAAASYSATITITDDAAAATEKVVNLSFAVTEPAVEETPVSPTSEWVVAATVADGMEVLLTGVKSETTYALSAQGNNNRTADAGMLSEGVFTPGNNTMSVTLEQQSEGKFALRTSNGKYLYAASSSANNLKTRDAIGDDGKAVWTISINGDNEASIVANCETTNWRNVMQFNQNGSNAPVFNCYASATQSVIKIYVPKAPEPPTPVYETVRTGLVEGRHYTVCLENNVTAVKGATFWSLTYKNAAGTEAYLVQENVPFAAGTPYIIQATGDNEGKLEVVYGEEVAGSAGTNGALVGTFSYLDAAALNTINETGENDVYMLFNNELRPIGTNNHLDAHRAYVLYNLLTPASPSSFAPGKTVKGMPMHRDAAQGFENLQSGDAPVKVMIDGTMYILRGEKVYDATGRLVK